MCLRPSEKRFSLFSDGLNACLQTGSAAGIKEKQHGRKVGRHGGGGSGGTFKRQVVQFADK
ncbi:hypothetical protein HMPREF9123_0452 [Neisseria bacilliformis ATCC BAA-1200]|uniref:Uncharacterized protein n=1 Tax=Neisseria bacilliformis ATCC BAA-1200 TaxID=888742 RepID=F2B9M9_9NEIS|nr:hypothetical protein HMPREF9123_0452 [Neisseria bacilliformis ATCC BAA-1200]